VLCRQWHSDAHALFVPSLRFGSFIKSPQRLLRLRVHAVKATTRTGVSYCPEMKFWMIVSQSASAALRPKSKEGRPERPPVQQKTSLLLHAAAAGWVGTVMIAAVPAIMPRASRTKMSFFMDAPGARVDNVLMVYRKALVSPCEVFTWPPC
jgi:hypothetical protein